MRWVSAVGHIMKRRYAAVTMARDEGLHLRMWHRYYAAQFGAENLYVIDHNSSTLRPRDVVGDDCNVLRLPFDNPIQDRDGDLRKFDEARFEFISAQVEALLKYYDCVIFNDADEVMFVDGPQGLRDYLDGLPDIGVRCGVGVEVIHHVQTEAAYDFDVSLFAQRRLFRYHLNFCKPWILSKPVQITGHGALSPFHIDPNLLLIHLRLLDHDVSLTRHAQRMDAFDHGRGGLRSRWALTEQEVENTFSEAFQRRIEPTRMGAMPHHDVLERFLPGYREQEFSGANYERKYGKRRALMQVVKFIDEEPRMIFQKRVYKFPEGFKTRML